MNINFQKLSNSIIKCEKCKRLVNFRKKISKEKKNNLLMKNTGENQLLDLVI